MSAYYNEHDDKAAAWLRELIQAKLIADGEVDTRSIVDVRPADLRGFRQCHFFAGIGGWSLALRLAGWPDDRPIWTGSCPCQPFSAAGAQAGGNDPRDLWPAWFQLIRECRPDVIAGEQVESAIAHGWLDRLCDDLEGEGYAVGAVGLPAASVGAFHIRQRLWFVAESQNADGRREQSTSGAGSRRPGSARDGTVGDLADTDGRDAVNGGLQRGRKHGLRAENRRADGGTGNGQRNESAVADDDEGGRSKFGAARLHAHWQSGLDVARRGSAGGVADDDSAGRRSGGRAGVYLSRHEGTLSDDGDSVGGMADTERDGRRSDVEIGRPEGRISGDWLTPWSSVEWIACRDGKARPVEPGTFPLAHGIPARVGRLRGYGNAIVPQVAAEVIKAYMETRTGGIE